MSTFTTLQSIARASGNATGYHQPPVPSPLGKISSQAGLSEVQASLMDGKAGAFSLCSAPLFRKLWLLEGVQQTTGEARK